MFAWLNFTVFVDQWKCSKIIWWLGLSIGLIHRGKVLVNIRYPALVDWAEGWGRGNGWIKAGKSTRSSSPHFRVCWGSEILQPSWQGSIYEVNWGEPKCESPVLPQCWGPRCFPYRGCLTLLRMRAGSHKYTHQTTELYRHLQCVMSVGWEKMLNIVNFALPGSYLHLTFAQYIKCIFTTPIPTLDPSAAWFPVFAKNRPQLSTV